MVIALKRSLLSVEKSRALARQRVSIWKGRSRHFNVMVENPVMRLSQLQWVEERAAGKDWEGR